MQNELVLVGIISGVFSVLSVVIPVIISSRNTTEKIVQEKTSHLWDRTKDYIDKLEGTITKLETRVQGLEDENRVYRTQNNLLRMYVLDMEDWLKRISDQLKPGFPPPPQRPEGLDMTVFDSIIQIKGDEHD